jgi:hypothetical protein
MTFNEFQRELRAHGVEGPPAYFFTLLYERLIETENQLTLCARLVENMATSMQGFVQLNEVQQREMRQFIRGGRPDGVEVASVANEPEDD